MVEFLSTLAADLPSLVRHIWTFYQGISARAAKSVVGRVQSWRRKFHPNIHECQSLLEDRLPAKCGHWNYNPYLEMFCQYPHTDGSNMVAWGRRGSQNLKDTMLPFK